MITVNEKERESTIQELAKQSLQDIKTNAMAGQRTTKIYYPEEIAHECKTALTRLLDEDGCKYTFMIVRSAPNPHTGRTEHFTGMRAHNGQRYYHLKIGK